MSLIPNTKSAKIAFFNSKIAPWTTNATAIGTTAGAVTALEALVTDAQTKLDAQVAAEQAAKTATMTSNNGVDAMVTAGSDIIKAIRAKAATAGISVYELAQIPDPATPTPVTTLGQPSDFNVGLGADGALTLKWKCSSPRASGVIYQVWRRIGNASDFSYLGGTGAKSFVDDTLPAGSSSMVYKLQAVRSTATGPWATFTVLVGMGSSGMTASVAPSTGAKLAA